MRCSQQGGLVRERYKQLRDSDSLSDLGLKGEGGQRGAGVAL